VYHMAITRLDLNYMEPSVAIVKRLFAASGNRCAFPECSAPIVETSGAITGIICHIKARSPGGPRYDPGQSEEGRHSFENLLLMCARHSKLIDSEPDRFTASVLFQMKEQHERFGSIDLLPEQVRKACRLLDDYRALYSIHASGHVMIDSPGAIQADQVVIKTERKSVKLNPPVGTIASDGPRRNYVKHLIDRYHKYASKQPGRKFRYGALYDDINRRFGAKWDYVPLVRFDELVAHLQAKIDGTKIGRINRGKGGPSYSSYERYIAKYQEKRRP